MLIIPSRTPRRRLVPAATTTPLLQCTTRGRDGCRQRRRVRGPCRACGRGAEKICMKGKQTKKATDPLPYQSREKRNKQGGDNKQKPLRAPRWARRKRKRQGVPQATQSSAPHSKQRDRGCDEVRAGGSEARVVDEARVGTAAADAGVRRRVWRWTVGYDANKFDPSTTNEAPKSNSDRSGCRRLPRFDFGTRRAERRLDVSARVGLLLFNGAFVVCASCGRCVLLLSGEVVRHWPLCSGCRPSISCQLSPDGVRVMLCGSFWYVRRRSACHRPSCWSCCPSPCILTSFSPTLVSHQIQIASAGDYPTSARPDSLEECPSPRTLPPPTRSPCSSPPAGERPSCALPTALPPHGVVLVPRTGWARGRIPRRGSSGAAPPSVPPAVTCRRPRVFWPGDVSSGGCGTDWVVGLAPRVRRTVGMGRRRRRGLSAVLKAAPVPSSVSPLQWRVPSSEFALAGCPLAFVSVHGLAASSGMGGGKGGV